MRTHTEHTSTVPALVQNLYGRNNGWQLGMFDPSFRKSILAQTMMKGRPGTGILAKLR
jgi:hypothetical protein